MKDKNNEIRVFITFDNGRSIEFKSKDLWTNYKDSR
jgi:negative regulator of genetic competence, sporulation and motility